MARSDDEDRRDRSRDRKEKRRSRSRSSSSSSSSGSSSAGDRKRRRSKDEDRKDDKKRKDEKREEKKRRKEEKKAKKEAKRAAKEAKRAAAAAKEAAASAEKASVSAPITPDDYFAKASEFRTWLKEIKDKFLDEMSSDKARKYFCDFVKDWNAGKLPPKYYAGIRETGVDAAERTRYKWGFAKNVDAHQLASVRDTIDTDTNKAAQLGSGAPRAAASGTGTNNVPLGGGGGARPGVRPRDPVDEENERDAARIGLKRDRKALERQHKETMEELVPKADPGSFQARLEKKAAKGAYTKNERDVEPEISERDLMGGGDDFKARLARERAWREKQQASKAAQAEDRRAAYEQKEREKMEAFKAAIGFNERFGAGGR
eukprot:tig00000849_g4744.t1